MKQDSVDLRYLVASDGLNKVHLRGNTKQDTLDSYSTAQFNRHSVMPEKSSAQLLSDERQMMVLVSAAARSCCIAGRTLHSGS